MFCGYWYISIGIVKCWIGVGEGVIKNLWLEDGFCRIYFICLFRLFLLNFFIVIKINYRRFIKFFKMFS